MLEFFKCLTPSVPAIIGIIIGFSLSWIKEYIEKRKDQKRQIEVRPVSWTKGIIAF